jgi:hypothetical protein
MILHDLIAGISMPYHARIVCARAVEGIRELMSKPNSNTKQAWQHFRDTLRLDRTYVDPITDISKDSRHGKFVHIHGDEENEIIPRSWRIMDRFFEFRKRGGVDSLPVERFPILK